MAPISLASAAMDLALHIESISAFWQISAWVRSSAAELIAMLV